MLSSDGGHISIDTANEANSMVHQDGGFSFSIRKCHDVSDGSIHSVYRNKMFSKGPFHCH